MWNYMCIRLLINWSDSTKMHGATIRFKDTPTSLVFCWYKYLEPHDFRHALATETVKSSVLDSEKVHSVLSYLCIVTWLFVTGIWSQSAVSYYRLIMIQYRPWYMEQNLVLKHSGLQTGTVQIPLDTMYGGPQSWMAWIYCGRTALFVTYDCAMRYCCILLKWL